MSNNDRMLEDATIRGRTYTVDLWYPRSEDNADTVQIDLMDVRAADGIQVKYDFDRDGWVILQDSGWQEESGASGYLGEDWHEVAFVPAWGRCSPLPQQGPNTKTGESN